jgi:hypothetical protein
VWRDNLGENGAAIWIGGGGRSDVMIRGWRGHAQVLFSWGRCSMVATAATRSLRRNYFSFDCRWPTINSCP